MNNPPSGGSNVIKPCEHKYIHLGQRRIKDVFASYHITKLVEVFYCEKCLDYKTLEVR